MNFIKNGFYRYAAWLESAPATSRVVTGFSLFGLGDHLCQSIMEKRGYFQKQPYDFQRTARLCMIGGFIATPLLWGWLNFGLPAITRLPGVANLGHWPKTAVCLTADQTVWAYGFNMVLMFTFHYAENFDAPAAWEHQSSVMWDVIQANWVLWPAVQVINLGLLPPKYRVVVVNFVAIFWNLYMSWKNQKGKQAKLAALAIEQAEEVKSEPKASLVSQ
jgi:protein Mpv17